MHPYGVKSKPGPLGQNSLHMRGRKKDFCVQVECVPVRQAGNEITDDSLFGLVFVITRGHFQHCKFFLKHGFVVEKVDVQLGQNSFGFDKFLMDLG